MRDILIQILRILLRVGKHNRNRLCRIHWRTTANRNYEIHAISFSKLGRFHNRFHRGIFFDPIILHMFLSICIKCCLHICKRSIRACGIFSCHNQCVASIACQFLCMYLYCIYLLVYFCWYVIFHILSPIICLIPKFPRGTDF